jgi:hypothetical protein
VCQSCGVWEPGLWELWCVRAGCVRAGVCESWGVWELWCVRVVVRESCGVWELRCARAVMFESCGVWELWYVGVYLFLCTVCLCVCISLFSPLSFTSLFFFSHLSLCLYFRLLFPVTEIKFRGNFIKSNIPPCQMPPPSNSRRTKQWGRGLAYCALWPLALSKWGVWATHSCHSRIRIFPFSYW